MITSESIAGLIPACFSNDSKIIPISSEVRSLLVDIRQLPTSDPP
jgi:hypothetical protein